MKMSLKKRDVFLPFAPPLIGEEEKREVLETLESGWLTAGPKVKRFEEDFCTYIGSQYAVATNSCTAALHLSLIANGIQEGDEVLVPTFTFASTAHVVSYVGAKPVLVDIDPITLNVSLEDLKAKVTSKTKAVIVVHYGGLAVPLDAVNQFAKEKGLVVIEDAAHAIGTELQGKKIGSFGNLTCFSFYATKNMTTGEGGMVTTDNKKLAHQIRILTMYGISDARQMTNRYGPTGSWFYDIEALGYKYNMTDIAAAIGIHQLAKVDSFIQKRTEIARYYQEELQDFDFLQLPYVPLEEEGRHAWHAYPVRLIGEKLTTNRDQFIESLREMNIGTSVLFRPLHLHSYYEKTFGYQRGDFPNAERAFESLIALPIHPKMSLEDARNVVEAIKAIADK